MQGVQRWVTAMASAMNSRDFLSPGYPVAAKIFEKALADIANGADVEATLDAATDEIDADIEKNGGYGH